LAPAIVALAPGAAELATQIAGVLVPAIQVLSPLLAGLARFISDNISWLGPLAAAVGVAAAAYKAYAASVVVVTAAKKALNSELAINTLAWIRNTASSVAARAAAIGTAVVVGGQAVAAWVANTAAMVANRVATLASAAVTGGAAVAAWVANTAVMVANRVALIAGAVAMAVVRGAVLAWTAVQWALNVALNANPIGLIVIAIAALVAGIIYAYRNSETFRNIVQAVWAAIKVAISAVVNWITGTVWPSLQRAWQQISDGAKALWEFVKFAWEGMKVAISTVLNAIQAIVSAVWSAVVGLVQGHIAAIRLTVQNGFNLIRTVVNTVMTAVRSVVQSIWAAIVSVVQGYIAAIKSTINTLTAIVGVIRGHFTRGKEAIQTVLTAAVAVIRGFPGRVTSALSGMGSLLYSKGRDLIQGFINGIKAMAGQVKNAAKSIVSSVTDFLPGSPAKEGPLSGQGYVVKRAQRFMDDFTAGINSKAEGPRSAIQRVTAGLAEAAAPRTTAGKIAQGIVDKRNIKPAVGQPRGVFSSPGSVDRALARIPANKKTTPSSSSGGTRTYNIKIGEKQFATLVVDAVTGNPVAVAKAANEGNRRTSWVAPVAAKPKARAKR
jgi:phage-related protein